MLICASPPFAITASFVLFLTEPNGPGGSGRTAIYIYGNIGIQNRNRDRGMFRQNHNSQNRKTPFGFSAAEKQTVPYRRKY